MASEPNQEGEYEERYVAFLDLLGFRDMVDRSAKGDVRPTELAAILSWLKRAKSDSKSLNKLFSHVSNGDPRSVTIESRQGDDRDKIKFVFSPLARLRSIPRA